MVGGRRCLDFWGSALLECRALSDAAMARRKSPKPRSKRARPKADLKVDPRAITNIQRRREMREMMS